MPQPQQNQSNPNGSGTGTTVLDPEVAARPSRRRFTAGYKLRILQEAGACTRPGELGELLRQEGLYSSHLTAWRRQRERGELQGLAPAKRGRKSNPEAAELARLRCENERLKQRLAQAETTIEVQKNSRNCSGCRQPRRATRHDAPGHRKSGGHHRRRAGV